MMGFLQAGSSFPQMTEPVEGGASAISVEASGTRFAAPTQLAYLSRDKGIDAEKATATVRRGVEPRASDVFKFPGEARTGTE